MRKIELSLLSKLPINSRIGYSYRPEGKELMYFPSAFFHGISGNCAMIRTSKLLTLPISRIGAVYVDVAWYKAKKTRPNTRKASQLEAKIDLLIDLISKKKPSISRTTSDTRMPRTMPKRPKSTTHG